jgi:nicotinamide-nucleotide amidase
VDSNKAFMAQKLDEAGVIISEIITIPDDPDKLLKWAAYLVKHNELVLVTGGLGPTEDDLTAQAMADWLDSPLVRHPEAEARIKERYGHRGLEVTDIALKQSIYPEKAEPMINQIGLAVAFRLDYATISEAIAEDAVVNRQGALFCLPGVPAEMRDFMEREVVPWLGGSLPVQVPSVEFFVFGLPESVITARYRESSLPMERLRFAINFREGIADVRLFANAEGGSKPPPWFDRKAFEEEIRRIYHGYLLPPPYRTLIELFHDVMSESAKTVSLAESCTGGGLAYKITSMPGSSKYFDRSFVTYSNESKMELLGVFADTLEQFGAVSQQTVKEMVTGVLHHAQSDYAMAISGIAGPGGGTEDKPVGTVFIGAGERRDEGEPRLLVKEYHLPGNRDMVRLFSVQRALFLLLRLIKKI